MSGEKPQVVIDNGSFNIKAGFSCDNHPVSIFRTVVGRPKYLNGSYGKKHYDVYIGDEATKRIEDYDMSNPVVEGKIVHWDNMERVWHHIFYKELKVAPEDRDVMFGCCSTMTMKDKLKCCEAFFETLNSPGVCIQPQSVLSMYGSGLTTGVSVDFGYDSTDICPVFEGGQIFYAFIRTGVAGRQIYRYIQQHLIDRGNEIDINSPKIQEDIRQYLYVSNDHRTSRKGKMMYKLPSGEEVNISGECYLGAELLFKPKIVLNQKSDFMSTQEAVVASVLKCDASLQDTMFDSIVPCGGLATLPGINERLTTEVKLEANRSVNVLYSPEPCTVSWLGGATLAGLHGSRKMWVTQRQYEEYGEKIVKNKFL